MSGLVSLRAGGHLTAIYPQSVEEVYRLATMALKAGMIKKLRNGYGESATEESKEAALARGTMIIMQGMEIGVPPMQAVQLLAMINGRITAHSEAVPGLLLAHGFKIKETWSGSDLADDWTCSIELTRPDGASNIGSFSVKDAKQAGLWDQSPTKTVYGKTKPNDSAWFRYPKRMLKARALGFASKDGGADALKGIQVREEAEDMLLVSGMKDITPESQPPKRKSSAAAKKDGTNALFEEIRAAIKNAVNAEHLAHERANYNDDWKTMPRAWAEILDHEYEDRLAAFGVLVEAAE